MYCGMLSPFKTWKQFIIANLCLGFVIALFSVNVWTISSLAVGTIWGTIISITQWLGQVWIQGEIEKKYSWFEKPTLRFIWTFISIIVYSILAYLIVQSIMNLIVFGKIPWYLYSLNNFWLLPVVISLLISIIAGSIGFFTGWKNSLLEQEQLKTEMLNYKYETLKNQINPHFMFNSLNVLSELVYDDQKLAVSFIHQFSDIYRYVLDKRNQDLVSIEEELAFINKFIFLLKTRFDDKLNVNIDLPSGKDEMVIPLALQLLIENAVKHNEVSNSNPLIIDIKRSGDKIIISNKIRLKQNSGENSKLIGLQNLKQQFSYFTEIPVEIESDAENFIVKLPILKTI